MVGKDGQLVGFFRKKIQETPIELMGKTMVSSRFSLKSTHWGGKPSPGNFPSLSPPGRRGEVRRPTAASKGGALWRPARMEEFFGMEKWEISTWKNGTNGDFDLENWEKHGILTWKTGKNWRFWPGNMVRSWEHTWIYREKCGIELWKGG